LDDLFPPTAPERKTAVKEESSFNRRQFCQMWGPDPVVPLIGTAASRLLIVSSAHAVNHDRVGFQPPVCETSFGIGMAPKIFWGSLSQGWHGPP